MHSTFLSLPNELKQNVARFCTLESLRNLRLVNHESRANSSTPFKTSFRTKTIVLHWDSLWNFYQLSLNAEFCNLVETLIIRATFTETMREDDAEDWDKHIDHCNEQEEQLDMRRDVPVLCQALANFSNCVNFKISLWNPQQSYRYLGVDRPGRDLRMVDFDMEPRVPLRHRSSNSPIIGPEITNIFWELLEVFSSLDGKVVNSFSYSTYPESYWQSLEPMRLLWDWSHIMFRNPTANLVRALSHLTTLELMSLTLDGVESVHRTNKFSQLLTCCPNLTTLQLAGLHPCQGLSIEIVEWMRTVHLPYLRTFHMNRIAVEADATLCFLKRTRKTLSNLTLQEVVADEETETIWDEFWGVHGEGYETRHAESGMEGI